MQIRKQAIIWINGSIVFFSSSPKYVMNQMQWVGGAIGLAISSSRERKEGPDTCARAHLLL